ncbi:hypothetical protein [Herbaspirillum camelliae]|uniref:hypothetical protein n=1 Tax=Herbaspirillum camelliae TaxID=1892903 RepID=UPI00094A122A|nr:hypothetical protein [Herbaspirillum camelliae]
MSFLLSIEGEKAMTDESGAAGGIEGGDPRSRPLSTFSPEAQAQFKAHGQKLVDVIFNRTMDAGFELIKHFVAINAAGVAGATAIASALIEPAKLAIPYFFGGLVVSIMTMLLVYVNGLQITHGMGKRFNAVVNSGAPIGTFKFSRLMWIGIVATWLLGLASILLFLTGAALLVLKTYPTIP